MNKKIFQKFTTLLTLCLLMISMPLDQLGNKPGYVLAATETPYVRFETVVTGLSQPLFATHAGDGSGRIFIVERGGKIRIYKNGALNALPFLNISSLPNFNKPSLKRIRLLTSRNTPRNFGVSSE